MRLNELAVEFLDYLNSARRLSPHTLSNYRRDLDNFLGFCEQQRLTSPADIDTAAIRQFIGQRRSQGLSGRSIQRQLSALRSFFQHLIRQHQMDSNPAQGVAAPKSPKRLPKALDTEAIQQLLNVPGNDWIDHRDRAIMELFYSSGLRLSELASLDRDTIDLREALVTVTGKGNKKRTVPVGRFALQALEQWLQVRNDPNGEERALFLSRRGSRLTPRAIQNRISLRCRQQGLNQHVHPHMLRHSFASHVLESSGNLRAVQELLGHANLSTTQVYTHLDFQHLSKVYDQAHPRAARKKK